MSSSKLAGLPASASKLKVLGASKHLARSDVSAIKHKVHGARDIVGEHSVRPKVQEMKRQVHDDGERWSIASA